MATAAGGTRHGRTHWPLAAAMAAALVLLLAVPFSPALQHLDFLWLDKLTARQALHSQADADIVIIDIDDYSLQAASHTLGRWPWPRATHAELVDWLEQQGARSIVFDIWFSEPDVLRPEFDQYFGEVLGRYRNIYLPTLLMNTADPQQARRLDSYPANLPITRTAQARDDARADLLLPAMGSPDSWHLGLVNYHEDGDGIARHYSLVREITGWQIRAMPLVLAQDLAMPATRSDTLRIAWHGDGRQSPYTRLSYADAWQQVQDGHNSDAFRNRIVLIGSTAAGLHDLRPTPLNAQYPGLYLLANAIDNLKNADTLHYGNHYSWLIGLPLLLWTLWRVQGSRPLQHTALQFLLLALLLIGASVAASTRQILLPVVSPLLASVLLLGAGSVLRYMQERAARQAALDMFGRFLDPLVVQQLAEQGLDDSRLRGSNCEISVLFSDIRGFTSMSEKATAAEIMALLNAYFSRQVAVIFRHHGTLDKFIGDAIMAFWGAPLPDANHARHAVAAALDMVDELDRFRSERGLDGFDIGIGIHSGPAVVGMLGSEQRLEYTAIGDTVNLGSRLEGQTKGIARILVSQSTRDACGDAFDFIAHGSCKVKGREEPVNIYEPRRRS